MWETLLQETEETPLLNQTENDLLQFHTSRKNSSNVMNRHILYKFKILQGKKKNTYNKKNQAMH